jgi:hypothetical protein
MKSIKMIRNQLQSIHNNKKKTVMSSYGWGIFQLKLANGNHINLSKRLSQSSSLCKSLIRRFKMFSVAFEFPSINEFQHPQSIFKHKKRQQSLFSAIAIRSTIDARFHPDATEKGFLD